MTEPIVEPAGIAPFFPQEWRERWKDGRAGWNHAVARVADSVLPAVWLREYWDRFIRDARHFNATIAYIHQNPVKAGLVRHAEEWPWSSAGEYGGASVIPVRSPIG